MDIARLLADLRTAVPVIAPSLLAADFAHLEREIRDLEDAGAQVLHLDVMDGHFVPNLSFGLPVVEAVRRVTELPLDVHLMISEPERFVGPFLDAGADMLSFHIEVANNPTHLLGEIRRLGAAAGIALSPPTPVSALEDYLDQCDLVLVMSVSPGLGGQDFQPEALAKLRRLSSGTRADLLVSIDGGVSTDTIGRCAGAGAQVFVVGTGLLGHPDYPRRLAELKAIAQASIADRVQLKP
jgi:ribulose-phosphate 3-epimerase